MSCRQTQQNAVMCFRNPVFLKRSQGHGSIFEPDGEMLTNNCQHKLVELMESGPLLWVTLSCCKSVKLCIVREADIESVGFSQSTLFYFFFFFKLSIGQNSSPVLHTLFVSRNDISVKITARNWPHIQKELIHLLIISIFVSVSDLILLFLQDIWMHCLCFIFNSL